MSVIAFIPVRGGSKSIPLKNIKLFCGKPLVCWSIEALESCQQIDEIIVATDSKQIVDTVNSYNYNKVKIYNRLSENAQDQSSTESVILEYINNSNLEKTDIFILVQATSPMIQTIDIDNAINLYNQHKYDSIISCVKNYRFYWDNSGHSLNYDYRNRPRRQDFSGLYLENGAFYINSIQNIIKDKNRLSGNIGIYEMPKYTEYEIDEPEDWFIMEQIMKTYVLKNG